MEHKKLVSLKTQEQLDRFHNLMLRVNNRWLADQERMAKAYEIIRANVLKSLENTGDGKKVEEKFGGV